MSDFHHRTLFSVPIICQKKQEIITQVNDYLKIGTKFSIFTINPEILVHAYWDHRYKKILQENDMNIADGVGVSSFLHTDTIKGRTFMIDLFELLEQMKKRIFLVGSSTGVIEHTIHKLSVQYPSLTVSGFAGPTYTPQAIPLSAEDNMLEDELLKRITDYAPDMIFVALGHPKQEYWVSRMKKQFPHISYMVVGGSFDTYSGVKPTPGIFWEKLRIEWLYRLLHEPKRIGRIINAVILYPILVFIHSLKRKD